MNIIRAVQSGQSVNQDRERLPVPGVSRLPCEGAGCYRRSRPRPDRNPAIMPVLRAKGPDTSKALSHLPDRPGLTIRLDTRPSPAADLKTPWSFLALK